MKHFSNISTLIFDFGGVLINLDLQRCIQNFKHLGLVNFEQFLGTFGQKSFFHDFEKGVIGIEEFRSEIRKLTSAVLTDDQIDIAWASFLCDIPVEKLEMLIELRKKYRIVLLSNTNPLHIEGASAAEFAKVGKTIYSFFDKCYFSYNMKMVKPDPEIFEKLLEDENIAANRCLFLDDGQSNIDSARNLGFQTYLVRAHEDLSFLLQPETFVNGKQTTNCK